MSMQVYENPDSAVITLDHHDPAETYTFEGKVLTTITAFPDGYSIAWNTVRLGHEQLHAPATVFPATDATTMFGPDSALTKTIHRQIARLIRAAHTPGQGRGFAPSHIRPPAAGLER